MFEPPVNMVLTPDPIRWRSFKGKFKNNARWWVHEWNAAELPPKKIFKIFQHHCWCDYYDIALATLFTLWFPVLRKPKGVYMTGREMQPLLAHERNLQGANFSQAREFRWEEFQEALGRFFRNTCKKCEIHRNPSKSYSTCSMECIARNMVNHSSHIRFSAAAPQLPGNALCGFFARLLLLQIGGGCLAWHSRHMLCLIEEVCHRRNPSQMYGMPKKMDEWIFTILVFFLLLYR